MRLRAWRKRLLSAATWRELQDLLARLDSFQPDVVLDLMGNHKAGLLAALTMSDRRIGLAREYRREPSSAIWISESVPATGTHSVDRMLSLLQALDLPSQPVDFGAAKLARALDLPSPEEAPASGAVVIHPGAGWENKRYPPDHWGRVAELLRDRAGLETRVISTPAEAELARQTVEASSGAAHETSAPDLRTLATELRGASLVLAGDTGPVHLAHALGTPVLCLMGPTDPEKSGPYGKPEYALWHALPCSFCHRRYDKIQKCMLDLDPETVADRALSILESRRETLA
ncbi:MAG: glycosyltransferase family 9 protein [Acidobacteriota bacterium]